MEDMSRQIDLDNKVAPISYLLYAFGVIGAGAGVFAVLSGPDTGVFFGTPVGPGLFLASIGVLWFGLWIESLVPVFD
jgi:hypothetical protein